MNTPANFRERIRPNSALFVKRSLLGPGKLYVKKGVEVKPQDELGSYHLSAGFASVSLSDSLGVSKKGAEKYLQRKKGEKIFKGELLALKKGLFSKKILISPTDGVIEEYDQISGDLRLRFLPKQLTLTSGVYGIIEEVNNEIGEVVIRCLVDEIFAVFGSGRERAGILEIVGNKSNVLTKQQLNPDMKGHILLTGALVYKEALHRAVEYGISGIITGGLNARDFVAIAGSIDPKRRLGTDIGTSVVALEGFGPIPLGLDIERVLNSYVGKFVFVNGNSTRLLLPALSADSIMALRKVVIPAHRIPEHQPDIKVEEIKVGSTVRIIWPPYVGSQGKVQGVDKLETQLPSGISTILLTVETNMRRIKVPYTNVELIS